MQWNKKSASLFAVLSLLLGSAGAIGLQAYAQQSPAPISPKQIQTQSVSPAVSKQENSATDQDNIQDNIQDTTDNGQPESATETNENLPGGGHQDQGGVNVDHQFEGVE